jgi:predicted nucleic acid-binding protein
MEALEVFAVIEITSRHVDRARQVQRSLSGVGQRGRKIPDLLIAAAAEERRLTLLQYDSDFDTIATATGQRAQWVVPRGGLD